MMRILTEATILLDTPKEFDEEIRRAVILPNLNKG